MYSHTIRQNFHAQCNPTVESGNIIIIIIRLSNELWRLFAQHWNGTALLVQGDIKSHQMPQVPGAWYNNYWFSVPWTETCKYLHITVKEMAPIIIAAIMCGHDWKGDLVIAFCDNTAVVAALNNRSCKEKQ